MRCLASIFALALAGTASAQSPYIEIRAMGGHRMTAGDTSDSARQLALVEARRQAIVAAVSRLQGRADLKPLQLLPVELEAYTAVIVQAEEEPAPTERSTDRSLFQVQVHVRLDGDDAVRRMTALRKDRDTSLVLVAAWADMQNLHQQIGEQTKRRATLSGDAARIIVEEQLRTVTRLNAKHLATQASAALARTEDATVGGRVPSAEGRQRARALAEAAMAAWPDSPDAHSVMGDVLVEVEELEAAEAEYRKALLGDPDSSAKRTKLAEALRLQSKFPEAMTELREALRINAGFAQAHSDLGMILRAQGSFPEAIAAYREAIRLDPNSADAHNGLAITFANQGQLAEAVAEFREIVRIDPDSAIGYYNLAYALADLDLDVEAAAALREVIRINPNHYNARFNLGELFRLEGKYDESAKQFREYLRLAPDTPQNRRNIQRAEGYIQKFGEP